MLDGDFDKLGEANHREEEEGQSKGKWIVDFRN